MNRLLYVPIRTERATRLHRLRGSATSTLLWTGALLVLFALSCSYLWANLVIVALINFGAFLSILLWLETRHEPASRLAGSS